MMLCYYESVPIGYSQSGSNLFKNITNDNSKSGKTESNSIEYPSFWNKYEIPDINGTLYQSPLKTVGVLIQNITTVNSTPDEIYTKLILSMRESLSNLDIIKNNSTDLNGTNIETLEYSYGKNSNNFKILQVMVIDNNNINSFTYFAEDILYDSFYPLIENMRDVFLNLTENSSTSVNKEINPTIKPVQNKSITEGLENKSSDTNSVGQPPNTVANVNSTSTYRNPYLGIIAEYPSSLKKTEGDNGVSFLIDDTAGIIIGLVPSTYTSLENFTSQHLSNLKSSLEDYRVTNMSQANLFTNPTQMILFDYQNNSKPYRGMEFITMDGTDAYIFTYFSTVDTFEKYMSIISDMVESIELRNVPRISE